MEGHASLIIRSDLIFTGRTKDEIIDGFLAVDGSRICCVEEGLDFKKYTGEHTKVLDMTGRVVTPGLWIIMFSSWDICGSAWAWMYRMLVMSKNC